MKQSSFEKLPLSEISSFAAWEQIEPFVLAEVKHTRFVKTFFANSGISLLANIIIFYLQAKGIHVSYQGNFRALRSGNLRFAELQANLYGIFTLLMIVPKNHSIQRNRFIEATIRCNGRVKYIKSFDQLLEYLNTIKK